MSVVKAVAAQVEKSKNLRDADAAAGVAKLLVRLARLGDGQAPTDSDAAALAALMEPEGVPHPLRRIMIPGSLGGNEYRRSWTAEEIDLLVEQVREFDAKANAVRVAAKDREAYGPEDQERNTYSEVSERCRSAIRDAEEELKKALNDWTSCQDAIAALNNARNQLGTTLGSNKHWLEPACVEASPPE